MGILPSLISSCWSFMNSENGLLSLSWSRILLIFWISDLIALSSGVSSNYSKMSSDCEVARFNGLSTFSTGFLCSSYSLAESDLSSQSSSYSYFSTFSYFSSLGFLGSGFSTPKYPNTSSSFYCSYLMVWSTPSLSRYPKNIELCFSSKISTISSPNKLALEFLLSRIPNNIWESLWPLMAGLVASKSGFAKVSILWIAIIAATLSSAELES